MMILIKKKGSLWPFMISAMMMVSSSSFADNSSKEIEAKSVFVDFGAFEKSFPDLAKLIKKEEFEGLTKVTVKNTIARESFEMNLSVTLADVVKYMFLKGLLSIPEDNLLWNLGGEIVYVDNGEKTVKFKKLSMDNHDNKEKPEIIITPQIDSESTVKVQFSAVLKINIDVDNNVSLQKLIWEDFYDYKDQKIFSIFDNFAKNFNIFVEAALSTIQEEGRSGKLTQFFVNNNFIDYYSYICVHDLSRNLGNYLFKDAYTWEAAEKHDYARETILLFDINLAEVKKMYDLCIGDFFDKIKKIRKEGFSVDTFNFFPQILQKDNRNHALKFFEKIAKENNVNIDKWLYSAGIRLGNSSNNKIELYYINNNLKEQSTIEREEKQKRKKGWCCGLC